MRYGVHQIFFFFFSPSVDVFVLSFGLNLPFSTQAPAFVFVDEIDAIAGRHARKDPRRRATFEALIAQLDGELVSSFMP